MSVKFSIVSWNNGRTARELSERLSNGRLMNKTINRPFPKGHYIINLGCGLGSFPSNRFTETSGLRINSPVSVSLAQSKQQSLEELSSGSYVRVPIFDTDPIQILIKARAANLPIVCRTHDRGHAGSGIVLKTVDEIRSLDSLPSASVYTLAVPKRREYRVHIGRYRGGSAHVIDITRKVRRDGMDEGVNDPNRPFVWNHDNGFIFERGSVIRDMSNDPTLIKRISDMAAQAVIALGLRFGAVDIVVEQGGRLPEANIYVLEVNTSPGMSETTLNRYCEFFTTFANGGVLTPFSQAASSLPEDDGDITEEN